MPENYAVFYFFAFVDITKIRVVKIERGRGRVVIHRENRITTIIPTLVFIYYLRENTPRSGGPSGHRSSSLISHADRTTITHLIITKTAVYSTLIVYV